MHKNDDKSRVTGAVSRLRLNVITISKIASVSIVSLIVFSELVYQCYCTAAVLYYIVTTIYVNFRRNRTMQ